MNLINKIGIVIFVLLVCSCNNKQIRNIPEMAIEYDLDNKSCSETSVSEQLPYKNRIFTAFRRENARLVRQLAELPNKSNTISEYIKPGAAQWSYSTIFGITHFIADSIHPLENHAIVPKLRKTDKIKISISYPPNYYTARYWTENYIGDPEKNEQYFQTIDVNNGILIVPDEDSGHIFEVTAVWESVNNIKGTQGYAKYVFFIPNNYIE